MLTKKWMNVGSDCHRIMKTGTLWSIEYIKEYWRKGARPILGSTLWSAMLFFWGHESFWRFFDQGCAMTKIWREKKVLYQVRALIFCGPGVLSLPVKVFAWSESPWEKKTMNMSLIRVAAGYPIGAWLDIPSPFQGLKVCSPTHMKVKVWTPRHWSFSDSHLWDCWTGLGAAPGVCEHLS